MPADLSALFDTLLVLAGLVLILTGLVMFIRSKTSTQASSVEAFGIKLNVTHPSLILVLAGVGLMLAPRLLPELPGKVDKPPPAVISEADKSRPAEPAITAMPAPAEPSRATQTPPSVAETPVQLPAKPAAVPPAPPRPSAPSVRPTQPAAPIQTSPAIVEAPARPPAKPAVAAAVPPPSAASIRPVQPAKPSAAAPKKPALSSASRTEAKPAPAAAALPAAAAADAAVRPAVTAKPVRQTIAYAALGLPTNRSFWSGETRSSYTNRVNASLQHAGSDVLRMDVRALEFGQTEFDAWWNESGQHPRSRELCTVPHAPVALLSARVEAPPAFSSIDSAYWPELKLRLFVCKTRQLYRQQKILSPFNSDAWPFSTELNNELEQFLRAYRGELRD